MMLLFLFPTGAFAVFESKTDTLIIDGEIIYIEKQEVSLDVDSLQDAYNNDVKDKPVRKSFLTAGLNGGLNLTSAGYSTSAGSLTTLDEFTGQPNSLQANGMFGVDLSAVFWSFPAGKSKVSTAAMAGINLNKIRIASSVILDESPFLEDSILQLRYSQGEVFLDYFRYTSFPFGEMDTAAVDYRREITEFSTVDIPLALRFTLSSPKSIWQYFTEIGVNVRSIRPGGKTFDNYLVNREGDLMVLRSEEFKPRSQLRPLFALGIEARLGKSDDHQKGYMTCGFRAAGSFPRSALNSGSLFVMDFSSYTTSLFLRKTF